MPPGHRLRKRIRTRLWTIDLARRTFVVTTPGLVWEVVVTASLVICVLVSIYAFYLVYSARKSSRELETIATAENRYMEKNSHEKERRRQILLIAGQSLARSTGMRATPAVQGATEGTREIRILKDPYPIDMRVEDILGSPDKRTEEGQEQCWIWQSTQWLPPEGWPGKGTTGAPWPSNVEKLLETRFDSEGRLTTLILKRMEPDGTPSWEHIGRTPAEWQLTR